jgi:hypothetical protein
MTRFVTLRYQYLSLYHKRLSATIPHPCYAYPLRPALTSASVSPSLCCDLLPASAIPAPQARPYAHFRPAYHQHRHHALPPRHEKPASASLRAALVPSSPQCWRLISCQEQACARSCVSYATPLHVASVPIVCNTYAASDNSYYVICCTSPKQARVGV